jgi:hypothetical protein
LDVLGFVEGDDGGGDLHCRLRALAPFLTVGFLPADFRLPICKAGQVYTAQIGNRQSTIGNDQGFVGSWTTTLLIRSVAEVARCRSASALL